jgi:hypothetical protein
LYNFENIGVAVSLVYGALLCFPPLFVAVNKGMGSEVPMMYAVCVYGYSFAIFMVGAVVCIIPVNALRWVVMLACGAHSVCFMLTNFQRYFFLWAGKNGYSALAKHQGDSKIAAMAMIAVTQMFLAFCFKLKFY